MHWKRSNVSLLSLLEWAGGKAPRVMAGELEAVVFHPQPQERTSSSRRAFREKKTTAPRSCGSGYVMPTRGIITHAPIARGEVILELPLTRALHATAAASVLSEWGTSNNALTTRRNGTELCRIIGDLSAPATPLPCIDSREPLLLTAALAVLREAKLLERDGVSTNRWSRWDRYIASLPPRTTPIIASLYSVDSDGAGSTNTTMERRLRAGEVSLPLLGSSAEPTAADKKQLMLAQLRSGALATSEVGSGALASYVAPATVVEVVPTSSIATSFYSGDLVPRGGVQSQRVVEVPAFLGHVQDMSRTLDAEVLSRMVPALATWHDVSTTPAPFSVDDDDERCESAKGRWAAHVAWAHFMVRSRAKWVKLHPQLTSQRSCVCAPIADLINHDGVHPNVTFVERPSTNKNGTEYGTLLMVASRPIEAHEELTSDYHDDVYYPETPTPVAGGKRTADRHAELMREIEQEQRYEMVPSGKESARHQTTASSSSSSSRRGPSIPKSHSKIAAAMKDEAASYGDRSFSSPHEKKRFLNRRHAMSRKEGAVADAEWAFRFGFVKSAAEKEADASCMWDNGLKERVARLTDIRRKGEPGEFVVGVPEGLHHLHAERERLQREKFQGKTIFPPQRA
ncbi:Hypothetical protein, putative [Bodo saltans]|uniref:SET domain-containing protein n=1 Tax=Bodo saltans TaxID=75058 RepID=A0A0S4JCA3_BODSA|nr:Hypothetical protein, putative [Bodo saltans]|eukprot:CUG87851.1 Hypothetical protein, putative [Bodo saltans]